VHGLRVWTYKEISAVRSIDGVEQWRVHWLGGDEAGPHSPTWEPIESFNGADEHPTDTLKRVRRGESSAPKDLASIRSANSNRMWNNKRVRARVFVEIDGEEVPIFKEGTMFVNSDKTALGGLPYVLKYDDPLESDEKVDPHSPDDHIEVLHTAQPRPDPETEYRRALRDTIPTESVLIIHSITNRTGRTSPLGNGPSPSLHVQ
jgi:hypothetical protein